MPSLLPIILQGASLGFSASISPGPLFFYLIAQSLTGGWKRGAIVAIAPLVSDLPLVLTILLLLDQIPALFLHIISLAGGIYVIYLALKLFQGWRENQGFKLDTSSKLPQNLGKAVLVNYSSPGPYLGWSLVNGPLLLEALRVSVVHGIMFIISFYGLLIGGMLVLAAIFSQAHRLGARIVRTLSIVSVIILSILGVFLVFRGMQGILNF